MRKVGFLPFSCRYIQMNDRLSGFYNTLVAKYKCMIKNTNYEWKKKQ